MPYYNYLLLLLGFISILYLYYLYARQAHLKKRHGKKKQTARVFRYKTKVTETSRNNHRVEQIVIVEIDNDDYPIRKALTHNCTFKPFLIGEEIEVFSHANKLYYWSAFQNGFWKSLQGK